LFGETVESGKYDSPKDLVRDALLAFLKADERFRARIQRLQKEIDLGLRDIERGNIAELDVEEVKRSARRRLSSPGA